MKLLIQLLFLSSQFIFMFSCVKKDNPEIIEKKVVVNNNLQTDTSQINWIIENIPDSIPIKIENGLLPYSISVAPSFSSTAVIKNDELVVFPTEFRFAELGRDYITIADAANQELTLPINVKTAVSPYNFFQSLDVKILGDTTFTSNQFIIQNAFWDYFNGEIYLKLAYGYKSMVIWIRDVFKSGNHNPKQISYSPNNDEFPNGDYEFAPKDSAQTISVDSLDVNSMQISFDFPAIDKKNHFNGNVRLVGQIKIINKK